MPQPLTGLNVLDFSQLIAGPLASMTLGDLGADVVKVESLAGDRGRQLGTVSLGGESATHLTYGRNKRSIALDLKQPEGRQIAAQLASRCDVLVEAFRPGVMERLGLGYEQLSSQNPGLVYCSISAFGDTGPARDRPGVDFILQAESGLMRLTGERGGQPLKVGFTIVDVTSGLAAGQAILAALLSRERHGLGQRVRLSLFEVALSLQAVPLTEYFLSGVEPTRWGNLAPLGCPSEVYQTRDHPIVVSAYFPEQWSALCRLIGRPDLETDPRFAVHADRIRHRDELYPVLQEIFVTGTQDEWCQSLTSVGVIVGRVRDYGQLSSGPDADRPVFVEVTHPSYGRYRTVGQPYELDSAPPAAHSAPPLLGEHTAEVLVSLGYDQAAIDRLRRDRVVGPELVAPD
jgi:crotonobetainyl-CoA:carnitine CoA-transferase CaiB-like acyl-CoA transferase